MTPLEEFAQRLEEAQSARREREHGRTWVPTATPASMLGYRCERRIVYQRLHSDAATPPNAELSSIFSEGDLHAKDVRRELDDLGYQLVDQETAFHDEGLDLRGHIDGRMYALDSLGAIRRVPVEIKSITGEPPASAEELAREDGLLGRYYAQMLIYLFLTNSPEGLMLFKSKLTGLWKVIAVPLDFDRAEELVKRAERVRDAVKLKVLPDRILDRSECPGCPFATTCLPGDAPVDPLLIAEDETLIQDMRERENLRGAAKRFDVLDSRIKERFKLTRGDRFKVDDFLVTKKVSRVGAVTIKTELILAPSPAAQGEQHG